MKKEKITSPKSSYLLRIFHVSFAAFSVLPLLIILYIFIHHGEGDYSIDISKEQLRWFLFILITASTLLFFGVKGILAKIVLLSHNLKKSLLEKMDRNVILDLAKEEGEVAELAKAFSDILAKLEANIKELETTKKTLYEVITTVGKAMTSIESFDRLVRLILETTINALGAEKGAIFSFDDNYELELKASVGMEDIPVENIVTAAEASIQWVLKERESLFIRSVDKTIDKIRGEDVFYPPLVYAPLLYRDKIWGVLCLSGKRTGGDFTEDEIPIISNLSYQIAISFENATLNKNIERTYFETVSALALAVEAKDPYSRGHSERVGEYAVKIGEAMGIDDKDIQTLKDASRLHDIGKIGIADSVLKKAEGLSSDERDVIRKHPAIGESIVRPLKTFYHLLEPIRHHHELLDGSGYPDGLKGEEIPLISRILTVADIYDAITSDRPYRKAMSVDKVREEFQKMIDSNKLDSSVVNTLNRLIEEERI